MTSRDEGSCTGEDEEREAIGGYPSPARHTADDGKESEPLGAAHHGRREESREPGPDGEVNTRAQASGEDHGGLSPSIEEGTEEMTAAVASGQVAYGSENPSGETGASGAESSSG